MTKERKEAERLVKRIRLVTDIPLYEAKQCAVIIADEISDEVLVHASITDGSSDRFHFWVNVKKEIPKI